MPQCTRGHVEVRGQLSGVWFLLSSCEDSGNQIRMVGQSCPRAPTHTEIPYQP